MHTDPVRYLKLVLILTAAAGTDFGVAVAQEHGAYKAAREAVVERFEAAAPAVGAPVPDVSLIDTKGKVHRLRDLAGEHYSVLVLGCLT